LRTNPFVTTLSTLLIIRGATFSLLEGERLSDDDAFSWLNHGIPIDRILLPTRAVLFPILAVLAWILLRRTIFGQHVYAVGGNEEASRLAGIRTRAVKVAAFAVSGFTAAVVAIQLLAYLRVAKPDTGTGYELDSIASCVVGGISLQGGNGSIVQAVFGCLLLQVLTTLITMSGFPDEYRTPVTGAVILTFAATDALSRRKNSR
jgi:ribose transport system permease protein